MGDVSGSSSASKAPRLNEQVTVTFFGLDAAPWFVNAEGRCLHIVDLIGVHYIIIVVEQSVSAEPPSHLHLHLGMQWF